MKSLLVLISLVALAHPASAQSVSSRALAPDGPQQQPPQQPAQKSPSSGGRPHNSFSGGSTSGPYIDQGLGSGTPNKINVDDDADSGDDSGRLHRWTAIDSAASQQDIAAANTMLTQELQSLCQGGASPNSECVGGDFTSTSTVLGDATAILDPPDPPNTTPAPMSPTSREDQVADLLSSPVPHDDVPQNVDGQSLQGTNSTSHRTSGDDGPNALTSLRDIGKVITEKYLADQASEGGIDIRATADTANEILTDANAAETLTRADSSLGDDADAAHHLVRDVEPTGNGIINGIIKDAQDRSMVVDRLVTSSLPAALADQDLPSELQESQDAPAVWLAKGFPLVGTAVQKAQALIQPVKDVAAVANDVLQTGNQVLRYVGNKVANAPAGRLWTFLVSWTASQAPTNILGGDNSGD